jgi:hypothetical protein
MHTKTSRTTRSVAITEAIDGAMGKATGVVNVDAIKVAALILNECFIFGLPVLISALCWSIILVPCSP